MKRDEEIVQDVKGELKSDRKISNANRIKVTVKNGIVTLGGFVSHYMDQLAAGEAAERVPGVKGVVQEIEVQLPAISKRDDEEITRSACTAIEHNSTVPGDRVKLCVSDGVITLSGEVPEEYQKIEAAITVSKVLGVKGVINNILVIPILKPHDITMQIERAFQHMATHHAQDIQVEVKGSKVILAGMVRAWIEKAEAEEAACEVPGVTEVENQLQITPLLEGKEKYPAKA